MESPLGAVPVCVVNKRLLGVNSNISIRIFIRTIYSIKAHKILKFCLGVGSAKRQRCHSWFITPLVQILTTLYMPISDLRLRRCCQLRAWSVQGAGLGREWFLATPTSIVATQRGACCYSLNDCSTQTDNCLPEFITAASSVLNNYHELLVIRFFTYNCNWATKPVIWLAPALVTQTRSPKSSKTKPVHSYQWFAHCVQSQLVLCGSSA